VTRLLINNPEAMTRVKVITVKDYSESVLKILHQIGVLHVEEGKEIQSVDRAAIEREKGEVNELLSFTNGILAHLPQSQSVPIGEDVEVIYTKSFEEISGEVRTLYNKTSRLHDQIVKLETSIEQLVAQDNYLRPLANKVDLSLNDLAYSGDFISSRVFVLPSQVFDTLQLDLEKYLMESVIATTEEETIIYSLAKTKDQKAIESVIDETGGKVLTVPSEPISLQQFLETIEERRNNLDQERNQLVTELQQEVGEVLERIVLLREALQAEAERLSVLEKAAETKYVSLIEGWIPEGDTEAAVAEIRHKIDYVFIDTRVVDENEEPPTKLRNFNILKPFQVIINLFGLPKYREWDPTPIVSYSFAFFFGLMANDVIYGLGIVALGRFLLKSFVDDPEADNFKLFQRMIYTCGGVSVVMGLISGTYLGDIYTLFGFENLALSAYISETLLNPLTFIVLALFIGFIHINLAHFLALIQAIRQQDRALILNKIALFTLQLGIPTILHAVLKVDIPFMNESLYNAFLYVMFGSVVLIVISFIMQRGVLGLLLSIFDIIGLLGDIMSYTRLAGVGLATYYLAFCFNLISDLFSNLLSGMIPGIIGAILGTIMAVLILVFGHILNTVLAGIGSFVHSLRLCFVEFLFKFYEGGGREYSPFKLRKRARVLLTKT
jgi:V/A-type H+-transporting ATPase subunit I